MTMADLTITPIGYQGPAQHTYTRACDGHHAPGPCPPSSVIEVILCAGIPYRCDGFDPADWEGDVPDLSQFRFLNDR